METHPLVWFCATGKTGLGHLRRCATIAKALRRLAPGCCIGLATNATVAGLEPADIAAFTQIEIVDRQSMADRIAGRSNGPIVVDTAVLPGLATTNRPLVLILRQTPEDRLERFRLQDGRPWDLVMVPNPRADWWPELDPDFAHRVEPVGWIYRGVPVSTRPLWLTPLVIVASGGGATAPIAATWKAEVDPIIAHARALTDTPFYVAQALGPRAAPEAHLLHADDRFDPGGDLHLYFAQADTVISTAGYNSVLELATTDVPALLVAIPRSLDNQMARACLWGTRLGKWHVPGETLSSGAWLAAQIDAAKRRAPWDLGPSGETAAAQLILGLAQ
ncbi:glycosyltransferase [Candidatus Entotheonella palauensis]|uniref:Glycosyl transferase family 28 C-terminal domain-containing protein n=1 Tax=Candidatus Entotheonella gemina TaxID=1429439 RepID=W4MHN4_9BACT|nr:glycosyltransferase [Candidatus Entotheonella palauensis]ETX09222.1 MAG: hypothetical protein ETSY2_00770 [Candidatus Entotheonella gemina]